MSRFWEEFKRMSQEPHTHPNGMVPSEWILDEGQVMMEGHFAVPLMRPVELQGVEVAAVIDPYNMAGGDAVARTVELVHYDEHALLGLWVERRTSCRFLVAELKLDYFYAFGWREFPGARGIFEHWGCNVGNLSYGYDRADGRVPDRDSYEGRWFVPRDGDMV